MIKKTFLLTSLIIAGQSMAAINLEQAINQAEKESKGQAISAQNIERNGESIYSITLYSPQGIQHININKEDGKTLPPPAFDAPKISLKEALNTAQKEGEVLDIRYHDGKRPERGHHEQGRNHGERKGPQDEARGERKGPPQGEARGEHRGNNEQKERLETPVYFVKIKQGEEIKPLLISAETGEILQKEKK